MKYKTWDQVTSEVDLIVNDALEAAPQHQLDPERHRELVVAHFERDARWVELFNELEHHAAASDTDAWHPWRALDLADLLIDCYLVGAR